jgi:hypothetical protein
LAPVFGTDAVGCKIPGTDRDGTYAVWTPSFLAVLDNDVQMGTPGQMGVKWLQYIATGKSATMLAKQDEFRRTMMERIDPTIEERKKKFEDYSSNRKAQEASIDKIMSAYDNKAVGPERDKIREKAAQLGLIPQGTSDTEFKGKLFESSKPQDPEITRKLKELEEFVK